MYQLNSCYLCIACRFKTQDASHIYSKFWWCLNSVYHFRHYYILYKRLCLMVLHSQQWFMFSVLLDSEKGSVWDLWALDWVQQKAECLSFCIGRSVTPAGQLPVSTDIDYEFGSRNPYNFLQVTYYKVSCFSGSHKGLCHDNCYITYITFLFV